MKKLLIISMLICSSTAFVNAQCDCATAYVLSSGNVTLRGGGAVPYTLESAVNIQNRADCIFTLESMAMAGDIKTRLNIPIPKNNFGITYRDSFEARKLSLSVAENRKSINVVVTYSLNGNPPCTKTFSVKLIDQTRTK
jgi:hypothetical protein